MQIGNEDYQVHDSYFIIVHPFTYVVITLLVLLGIALYALVRFLKKKK